MSKKKVASRSAMTLKDFHGGSIPSDLPLPSAPGMTVDRSVYERQASGTWMSPTLGRGYGNDRGGSYHRTGSANGVRTFEDKASYFPNPANIGRNYDEDERKPIDSRPRSSHSADRFDDHSYEERRAGYSADRYNLEDQGSYGSAPSFSEPRSLGSSDRFPRPQVTGSSFESEVYVHEEFGLIPAGRPPSRVSPQDLQSRQQPSSHQREVVQTRTEQSSYAQLQQLPIQPTHPPQQQQVAASPPRSWRNPQNSTSTPVVAPESATGVWAPRRDGELNRASAPEPPRDVAAPSPWRPQGTAGRASETRVAEKVPLGWWPDSSRPLGVKDKLPQFSGTLPEQGRESPHQKSYGPDFPAETARGSYLSDVNQPRLSAESARGFSKSESGRGMQASAVGQVADEGETGRLGRGEEELRGGGFSATDGYMMNTDAERVGYSGSTRGGLVDLSRGSYLASKRGFNVDGGKIEAVDRTSYKDSSAAVGGLSGTGLSSNSGRFGYSDPARSVYPDTSRYGEADGFLSSDGGHAVYQESGRTPAPEHFGSSVSYASEAVTVSSRGDSRVYASDGNSSASIGDGKRSWSPLSHERSGAEASDRAQAVSSEGRRTPLPPVSTEASWASSGDQPEALERPKLKLLPRSKPLEKETSNFEREDVGAGCEEPSRGSYVDDKRLPEVKPVEAVPKRPMLKEHVSANEENDEDGNRRVERPKLNLKPRSQAAEAEPGEGSQKVRQLVFGGARPRELVLKERGVDDVLAGTQDVVQAPVISSLSSAISGVKLEQADAPRVVERLDSRGDEKQDGRRYDWQERSVDRQGSYRVDRQDSSRGPESKWDSEKESQWDQERPDRRKREVDRQDTRRDTDNRRDVDKQESWRRPVDSLISNTGPRNSGSTVSSLVDPSPRVPGRYGYSPTASAVELAQVFSRSSSIGSTVTSVSRGGNSLQSPMSPNPKSFVQGNGPGYGNGTAYMGRDAPFSRLAEGSTPPFGASGIEVPSQGGGFGLESHSNFYGSGKLGGYRSTDMKRGPSGRTDLGTGWELSEDNDDFPGKRGLPLRQKEGYYD